MRVLHIMEITPSAGKRCDVMTSVALSQGALRRLATSVACV